MLAMKNTIFVDFINRLNTTEERSHGLIEKSVKIIKTKTKREEN